MTADLAAFLRALRRRVAAAGLPPAPPALTESAIRQVASDADLVERLSQSATRAGWSVSRCVDHDVPRHVAELLCSMNLGHLLCESERVGLADTVLHHAYTVRNGGGPDEAMFMIDGAIVEADAAIAETGTVVVASGSRRSRSASLVPPTLIALVARARIVADLFDYFATPEDATAAPSNINLITGPSKTADIEGILITGVHGPGRVHLVIVEPDAGR